MPGRSWPGAEAPGAASGRRGGSAFQQLSENRTGWLPRKGVPCHGKGAHGSRKPAEQGGAPGLPPREAPRPRFLAWGSGAEEAGLGCSPPPAPMRLAEGTLPARTQLCCCSPPSSSGGRRPGTICGVQQSPHPSTQAPRTRLGTSRGEAEPRAHFWCKSRCTSGHNPPWDTLFPRLPETARGQEARVTHREQGREEPGALNGGRGGCWTFLPAEP